MSELIYVLLDESLRLFTEEGTVRVTCVETTGEGNGCNGCYFKRAPGKPQDPFCKAVACGAFERMDGKDVIFQELKTKD